MGEFLGRAGSTASLFTLSAILAVGPAWAQEPPSQKAPSQKASAQKAPKAAAKKTEAKAGGKKAEKPAEKEASEGGEAPGEEKPDLAGQAGGAAAGDAGAPAVSVPLADLWVLDFRFQKAATVQPSEGLHRGEVYWYLLYRIENKTGQDRDAYISISARSNKDKSYADVFLPDVESLIERRAGKPLWWKADEFQALKERAEKGEITAEKRTFNYFKFKAGETRDCVAIFNKLDPGATDIKVTVEGLSNDFHLLDREGGKRQVQSRMYVLELERPGDEYAISLDRIRLKREYWTKKLTDLALRKEG